MIGLTAGLLSATKLTEPNLNSGHLEHPHHLRSLAPEGAERVADVSEVPLPGLGVLLQERRQPEDLRVGTPHGGPATWSSANVSRQD